MDRQNSYFDEYILAVLRHRFEGADITVEIKRRDDIFLLVLKRKDAIRMAFKGDGGTTAAQLLEVSSSFRDFADNDLTDGMLTEESVERFMDLPGRVELLSENRMALYHRISLTAAQKTFGSHLVTGVRGYGNMLTLLTREGEFTVSYTDFRNSLKETLDRMKHFMRKPLVRDRYENPNNNR